MGPQIASASADGTVKLRRRDGSLIQTISIDTHEPVLAVAYSPNGQYLALGSSAATGTKGQAAIVRLIDDTRVVLGKLAAPVVSVAFAPNSQTIATASEDGLVRLWNLQGKLLKTVSGHDAPVRSVTFSPAGQTIATASDDRTIRLWRKDGTPFKTLVGHTAQVRSVAYSPDGKLLVPASWDETVRLAPTVKESRPPAMTIPSNSGRLTAT